MCGIFGSTDKEKFLTLYNLNKQRGTFSTSISLALQEQNGDVEIHKWSGSPDVEEVNHFITKILKNNKVKFFLGHTQAPTSSKRKFSKETSHPFYLNNWVVAHNGILTNFIDLKDQIRPAWKNPVDSSVIPPILSSIEQSIRGPENSVHVITTTLGLLEGTYGLWIYNTNTEILYLARCGSTIFADVFTNTFSSIKFKGSEALEEGVLYQLTKEGITSIGMFDFNSPFFT